jgi:small subunit ribosomal protein S14
LTECHKIPRQSSKVRVKSRCLRTNRSRSINQLLRISRQECRRLALDGQIPGLTRSTW